MISCHHHHLKRPSGICDCWDDNKDIFSDIGPRSQKFRHRHRHDVNLKSETYSQIIKGGRGQSVLYSCPCNGHVKDPNFTTPLPQRCPLINISLSSSSLEVFTSSQVTFLEKIQEPAAGDNGAENSAGFIWHCSCQRVVGIFVMPGIATSKTLLLFMWGNATWRWPHISISIGILSCEDITGMARVFTTHKDRNIPYSL